MKADASLKFARDGWNGKNMYIQAQIPDENSKMKQPYIFIVPGDRNLTVPWVASHADLFGEDWNRVDVDPNGVTSVMEIDNYRPQS